MTTLTVPEPVMPADEDAARAVWLRIATLIVAGLPAPAWVDVAEHGTTASITLPAVDDVAVWATAMGAPGPVTTSHISREDPSRLLTYTSTACLVEAGTWLTISHLLVSPAPDAGPRPDVDREGEPPCS